MSAALGTGQARAENQPSSNGSTTSEGNLMKQMILTGLATEQSFSSMEEAQYYLVFNDGELRVPISEEGAKAVIGAMYAGQNGHSAPEEVPEPEGYEGHYPQDQGSFSEDEDGVEQI